MESEKKPYRGIPMEGALAAWYAKITRKDAAQFEQLAGKLAAELPSNARVLEIAPGPGYLSVALAKRGAFKITGLDISQSFVHMASQYAKKEGVVARFIHGSVSNIPLEDGMFDLIVCRAAFKNFSEPLQALNEMHRVLKAEGKALIIDLRKDASWDQLSSYVDGLHLSRLSTWSTKMTFKHMLLKRAYTEEQMKSLVGTSDFKSCQITATDVAMDIHLLRRQPLAECAA